MSKHFIHKQASLTWKPNTEVTWETISGVFWTRCFLGCSPATRHNHYRPEGKPSCCWASCKSSYWQRQLSHAVDTRLPSELKNRQNKFLLWLPQAAGQPCFLTSSQARKVKRWNSVSGKPRVQPFSDLGHVTKSYFLIYKGKTMDNTLCHLGIC